MQENGNLKKLLNLKNIMDEVVCISSEDEMKVEDIVEVFEEVSWYIVTN